MQTEFTILRNSSQKVVLVPFLYFSYMDQASIILKWETYIKEEFSDQETQAGLIKYTSKLIKNNVPIIFNFDHLSKLLDIRKDTLIPIIFDVDSQYCSFQIPKRNGGVRSICAPYPTLMFIQRWIYDNILSDKEIHPAATGFIKQKSIVDNAKAHLDQRCLLKMDLKDFFPSITKQNIYYIFKGFGYSRKVAWNLATFCSFEGVLPQGAPTSPALSNILAKKLDRRLAGFAKKFDLIYTRYADDLTFSGYSISAKMIQYIEEIIQDQKFRVNKEKTKLIIGNKQKIITGISISSNKITIPKERKREIRKNIYHVLTKGLFEHLKNIGKNDAIYIERLLGYLYFWKSVEPENQYVEESIISLLKYSEELNTQLKEYIIK